MKCFILEKIARNSVRACVHVYCGDQVQVVSLGSQRHSSERGFPGL